MLVLKYPWRGDDFTSCGTFGESSEISGEGGFDPCGDTTMVKFLIEILRNFECWYRKSNVGTENLKLLVQKIDTVTDDELSRNFR